MTKFFCRFGMRKSRRNRHIIYNLITNLMKEFRDMLAEMFGEKWADQLIAMLEQTM